jgi:hypothetical protein
MKEKAAIPREICTGTHHSTLLPRERNSILYFLDLYH